MLGMDNVTVNPQKRVSNVIISKFTQEVLWWAGKNGSHFAVELRCPSCRGWVRIRVLGVEDVT